MIDIRIVRETPEVIKKDLKKRGWTEKITLLDHLIVLDEKWRKEQFALDKHRKEKNTVALEIAELKKAKKDANQQLERMKKLTFEISQLETDVANVRVELEKGLMSLPNILHESVPVGKSDEENVTVREWGTKPKFKFVPKSHVDLLTSLDIADIERAAKTSGARFYFLKNELVLLDYALMKFALDQLHGKGYVPIEPPYLLRTKPYEGVTDLNDFKDVMYKIEGEDLHLIATAEHPMAAMFMEETFDRESLPLKLVGISPSFRKEAGAHGKDTKGIFRVHQFNKVEQFIFSEPKDSWKLHEELIKNAEEIFQKLEIPYRVVNICTGDIGTVAAKKYDIEAWMPAQGTYREVVSGSNCTDYQANRLKIRYRDVAGEPAKAVHTLNCTAIATTRAMVAILENHQTADGTVKIPKALWPYMNGIKEIKPKKKERM